MKKQNRRKFLFAGLSLAAFLATLRFTKQKEEKKTIKPAYPSGRFLTQDGKLVEIDANKIPITKQAATKQDLQNWVKKNKAI
ncbi:MAG: hypothetical protein HYR67_01105 [Bacteroidetes bacterium]|nr:hypothetical protein [Bacteroidota bacterium]